MRQSTFVLVALLLVSSAGFAQTISYPDFSSVAGLTLNMHAAQSGNVLRVTPSLISQRGSAWLDNPFPVAAGFDVAFGFQVSAPSSGGGDGMAFVIQNDPRQLTALGNHASAMGYGAFATAAAGTAIANSLVVEIDTYLNTGDLSGNEISIHTNGTGDNGTTEALSIGRVSPTINFSDAQPHQMRVRYTPGTLDVFLDDFTTPVLSVPYDFALGGTHVLSGAPVGGLSLLPGGSAIMGFVASTGGAWENHDILWWSTAAYETNDTAGSFDVNGVTTTGFSPAATTRCGGQSFAINSTGTGPYEIGAAFAPVVAGGILQTGGGQLANLDISSPSLFYLNGGTALSLQPHPGSFTLNLALPAPTTISGQQMTSDPGHPDGFQLSQAPQVTVVTPGGGAPLVLTLGDDATVQVPLSTVDPCANSISFYGTVYTDIWVNSNGDVSLGMGSTDFTATVGEWTTQMPRIGIQSDLQPNLYGTVSVAYNGTTGVGDWITVAYQNVTEWGTNGMGVTSYNVEFHGPNGHEIGAFTTDGTWGTTAVVGGMSLGLTGTHPGIVSFDTLMGAGVQVNTLTTDSVIDANTSGMLLNTSGWSSIQFPFFDGSAYLVN